MNEHFYPLGRLLEQAARFDDLETLVHQCGRVDCDPPAHLPGRMGERLLDRDGGELSRRGVEKRPTRRGEPDALDFAQLPPAHALVHSVVLAVDGQQWLALSLGL